MTGKEGDMGSSHYTLAQNGNIFVLTSEGYEHCKRFCKEEVLRERAIGKPVSKLYTDNVPVSWLKHGWVKEVKTDDLLTEEK